MNIKQLKSIGYLTKRGKYRLHYGDYDVAGRLDVFENYHRQIWTDKDLFDAIWLFKKQFSPFEALDLQTAKHGNGHVCIRYSSGNKGIYYWFYNVETFNQFTNYAENQRRKMKINNLLK